MEKGIIGLTESIKFGNEEVMAKVDTGAARSSIDVNLAKKLGLTNDLWDITKVKSSNGVQYRPVIRTMVRVAGNKMPLTLTVADRSNLKYKVLLGVNLLKNKFLVDTSI